MTIFTPLDIIYKNELIMYFYIYILQSEKDKMFYTGYTNDLKGRIKIHNNGKVQSTKNRIPLKLIYFDARLQW